MAYIAYHFHWSRDEVLDLSHRERHKWVEEISAINKRINKASGASQQQSGPLMFGSRHGPRGFSGGLSLTNPGDDDEDF